MNSISDKVFSQYGELANQKGISSLPEPWRTVIAIYTAQGIIDNGGFAYFFESDFKGGNDFKTIINSYRNIGLEEHAKSIENVLSLFPENRPHVDTSERDGFIYKYLSGNDEENYCNVVEDAEAVFYKETENVYKLADNYAIKNV